MRSGRAQALPTPGRISIGSETVNELEVYPADGHTADGVAYWIPWAEVLICGDYLSPVEIPMISADSGGSFEAYRETLLPPLPAGAQGGHGGSRARQPAAGERALEILTRTSPTWTRCCEAARLSCSQTAAGRPMQKQIHERNLASMALER